MFTDAVLSGPLLVVAGLGMLGYWRLLGSRFDSRMLVALNFSLITVWIFASNGSLLLRGATLWFLLLFVLGHRLLRHRRLAARMDSALDVDLSAALLLISLAAVAVNLGSGATSLAAREILLEQRTNDSFTRYSNYLLLTGNWLSVHVICRAATQDRWSRLQIASIAAATAAISTGLSKASFLPILLTLLFVYSHRIGTFKLLLFAGLGIASTLLITQRLFDGLALSDVSEIFFARIVKNVDVLDYVEALGPEESLSYPHASIFYPFWPVYQFTQTGFVVPGVWLHGTLWNDWRGFGPNPTFVGDLLIASSFGGLLLAPWFGRLLRAADHSSYRVFIAMVCYQFLQDWYYGCLNALLFGLILAVARLIPLPDSTRRRRRRRRLHEDRHSRSLVSPGA